MRGQQRFSHYTTEHSGHAHTVRLFHEHGGSVTLSPHASRWKHSNITLRTIQRILPDEDTTVQNVELLQKRKQTCIVNVLGTNTRLTACGVINDVNEQWLTKMWRKDKNKQQHWLLLECASAVKSLFVWRQISLVPLQTNSVDLQTGCFHLITY